MNIKSLLVSIFLLFMGAQASGNLGQIIKVVRQFDEQLSDPNRCYENINLLCDILAQRDLVNIDQSFVWIAESSSNNLILHDAQAYFHVFLVHDGYVIDPLLIALGMNRLGVLPIEAYFEKMFPELKGVKFSILSARSYLQLNEQEILGLFSQYMADSWLPLGRRMIDIHQVNPSTKFRVWRSSLSKALLKSNLRGNDK